MPTCRTIGTPQAPVTADLVTQMLALCDGSRICLSECIAPARLGGRVRRFETMALEVADLDPT
jgi:hypothetical protein